MHKSPGRKHVFFSHVEKRDIRTPWLNTIIVKLHGSSLCYKVFYTKLKYLWSFASSFTMINLGLAYYSITFTNPQDLKAVIKDEPCFINGNFLTIRKWEPKFKPLPAKYNVVAAQVRIEELPLEYCVPMALKQIASVIGSVLRIDM